MLRSGLTPLSLSFDSVISQKCDSYESENIFKTNFTILVLLRTSLYCICLQKYEHKLVIYNNINAISFLQSYIFYVKMNATTTHKTMGIFMMKKICDSNFVCLAYFKIFIYLSIRHFKYDCLHKIKSEF